MAVLEKIRVKFGILISILIAVALLSFILDPQTLASASRMLSSDNQVGKMAGESISYQDFYQEVDNITKIAEILGQNPSSEQAQSQLRDAAWQKIFDREVFFPKAESAGLAVSDAELLDLTQGSQISPVLYGQPMFLDQNGNFSRETFINFVQSIDSDESGYSAKYYDFLEESIYSNQLYTKYSSLISATSLKNAVEKSRAIAEGNSTADVDYISVTPGFARDSSIKVTSDEIRAYYKEHKHLMQQPATRDFEYVMWEVVPSAEDVSATREEFDALYEEFQTADNLKNFVTINSDQKFDTYYYKPSQLESVAEIADLISGAVKGTSAVHVEENSFMAARIADTQLMSDSVHVFFAAFPYADTQKADSLCKVVLKKGAVTEEFQELGWLTQEIVAANKMSDFAPVFSLDSKATVVKSSTSQANFVLFVSEKTKPVLKYQMATLVKNVLASDATYRDFQMQAAALADASDGSYDKFSAYVSANNLPVIPINNMRESNRRVGVAENARELVRWIFDKKTKKGSVSDVISVDNKYYFVAALTGVHKEGTATVQDVASQIQDILYAEKAVEAKYAEVKAKVEGQTSLEAVAESLGTTVSHSNGVSFGSLTVTVDPALIGAVAVAPKGSIGVVKGTYGVYVYQVADRAEGSFFTDADVKTADLRTAQYQSSIMQTVITSEADVKDYRARFF